MYGPGQRSVSSSLRQAFLMYDLPGAQARPEGVNRPELLPAEMTSVIDVAGFLTPSEVGESLSLLDGK